MDRFGCYGIWGSIVEGIHEHRLWADLGVDNRQAQQGSLLTTESHRLGLCCTYLSVFPAMVLCSWSALRIWIRHGTSICLQTLLENSTEAKIHATPNQNPRSIPKLLASHLKKVITGTWHKYRLNEISPSQNNTGFENRLANGPEDIYAEHINNVNPDSKIISVTIRISICLVDV